MSTFLATCSALIAELKLYSATAVHTHVHEHVDTCSCTLYFSESVMKLYSISVHFVLIKHIEVKNLRNVQPSRNRMQQSHVNM